MKKRRKRSLVKSQFEKYINDYIRKNLTVKAKSGYAAWLRKNGIDKTASLSNAVGKAYAEEEKRLAKSSSLSEALAESSLSKSGYAGYLKEITGENRARDTEKAVDEYLKNDSANKSSYAQHVLKLETERIAAEKKEAEAKAKEEAKKEAERLKAEAKAEADRIKAEEKAKKEAKEQAEKLAKEAEKAEEENRKKYEKLMQSLYKETKAAIESSKTTSYDEAYDYAIKKGLDEKTASELAKTTTDAIRESAVNKVINAIVSRYMTKNQAKEYALMLGLSEKDASTLGEFAFKINESASDIVTDENYLNSLREQIEQNNKKG